MDASQSLVTPSSGLSLPSRARLLVSAARYLFAKVLTIAITIFVGVFLTILLVSYPSGGASPFENNLVTQIDDFIQFSIYRGLISRDALGVPDRSQVEALT